MCRDSAAMISFTVMDWDVLTADDFGGEAFISLRYFYQIISYF